MALSVGTELALTSLLGGTLVSQMGLPRQLELILTTLKMDLLKENCEQLQYEAMRRNLLHSN